MPLPEPILAKPGPLRTRRGRAFESDGGRQELMWGITRPGEWEMIAPALSAGSSGLRLLCYQLRPRE
jgi:hypothetical protein